MSRLRGSLAAFKASNREFPSQRRFFFDAVLQCTFDQNSGLRLLETIRGPNFALTIPQPRMGLEGCCESL